MEKTIIIDDQEVRFKSTGATPLRYKSQFGEDFFVAITKLEKLSSINKDAVTYEDIAKIDFETLYNICWVLAKTANKEIPDPITWLDSFDSFPLMDVIPELGDLIMSSVQSKKK